jgi:hypothetical protein
MEKKDSVRRLRVCAQKLLIASSAKKEREEGVRRKAAKQTKSQPNSYFTVSVKLSGVSDAVVAVIVTVPAFEPVV